MAAPTIKPKASKPSQVGSGGLVTRMVDSPGLGILRTHGATPRDVPERAWVDGRNVRFTRLKTRVRKLDGYTQVDTTPDDETTRLLWRHHALDDTETLVRVGTARVWTGLAGDRVQVGSGLTGSATDVISAAQYKDRLVWTDGDDPVMTWQPSGVSQPLGGLGSTRAKIVVAHRNHILLFNVTDDAGRKPWRAMWSGLDTPDVWTSDTAGDLDFLESPGGITAAGVLGEVVIVHRQHGVHRMAFVGTSEVAYTQDPIPGHDGAVGPNAWINLDLFQYYKGAENFYRLGAYPEKIGDPIIDEVRAQLDPTRDYLTIASYRPEWDEIHWRMCRVGDSQPTFAVIYNVRDQTWSLANYAPATAVEQHPNPGGSPTSPRFGDLAGRLYQYGGTAANGVPFTAYVESTVYTAGLRPHRLLRVPVIATGAGTLQVRTRSWMDDRQPGGVPAFVPGAPFPLANSTKPWVDVRGYGRRHQVRFESTGLTDDWELEAYGLGELPGMGDR